MSIKTDVECLTCKRIKQCTMSKMALYKVSLYTYEFGAAMAQVIFQTLLAFLLI